MMTPEEELAALKAELWQLKNPTASSTPMAEEATTRTALQQQAITKARNAEYAGASAVQDVDAGRGALGNIAKVLTAWGVAKQGKKRNEAAADKLGAAADKENVLAKTMAAKKEADRIADIARRQGNADRTFEATGDQREVTNALAQDTLEYNRKKLEGAEAVRLAKAEKLAKADDEFKARGNVTQAKFDDNTRKLGKDLIPNVRYQSSMDHVWKTIAPYQNEENIPGIGVGEGGTGSIGSVLRFLQSGEDGGASQRVHEAVAGTVNQMIRDRAGLTQSKSEMERVLNELALDGLQGEEGLITALRQIERAQMEDLKNTRAGYSPEVVANYMSNYDEGLSPLDWSPNPMKFASIGETPEGEAVNPVTAGALGDIGRGPYQKTTKQKLLEEKERRTRR